MRAVFMGTPAFAVPTLAAMVGAGRAVELVVTQPDRPVGRKQALTPSPVKIKALELGLAVFQPRRIKSADSFERLAAIAARQGLRWFTASTLADNHEMLAVFRDSGFAVRSESDHGVLTVRLDLAPSPEGIAAIDERNRQGLLLGLIRAGGANVGAPAGEVGVGQDEPGRFGDGGGYDDLIGRVEDVFDRVGPARGREGGRRLGGGVFQDDVLARVEGLHGGGEIGHGDGLREGQGEGAGSRSWPAL